MWGLMWRMVLSLPSQSDRVPPSLFVWPGVPHPGLASSRPQGCGVSSDTRCPATPTSPTVLVTLDTYKTAIACGRLISVSVTRTLLRVGSFRARPRKTGDTGCSGQRGGDSLEREQTTGAHLRKALLLRDQPLVRWSILRRSRQGDRR